MVDQVNTLSVRAILASDDYVRGAQAINTANSGVTKSAAEAGAALVQVDLKATQAGGGLGRLTKTYDQAGASQMRFQSDLRALNTLIESGKVSTQQATVIYAGMAQRLGMAADGVHLLAQGYGPLGAVVNSVNADMARHAAQIGVVSAAYEHQQAVVTAANSNIIASNRQVVDTAAQYRRQNLGMQLGDTAQSLALGAPLSMVALQQGPQILQLYAAQGGLNAAMRDFMVILGGVARVAGPAIAILGGLYGGYKVLEANSVSAGLAVDAATRALAAQAAPISSLKGQINELAQIQIDYNKALADSSQVSSSATNILVANTKREYDARKALLDLELLLQEAKLRTMQSDIALAGQAMRERIAGQVMTDPSRATREGFADPRINGGIPFVRVPDEISGLQKTLDTLDADPAKNEIAKMRAETTLAELSVQKLREALAKPFEIGGDPLADTYWSKFSAAMLAKQQAYRDMQNPVPTFPNGVPIPTPRPIDATEDMSRSGLVSQTINGERSNIVERIKAQQQLVQTQSDQIEQLRLEAELVGKSSQERATMTAALQAEQQLRQQGINILSQEGQAYRDNAVAMAEARVQIERSQAAYASYQQAGSSAIDALTASTGSLQDRLKGAADAMLSWVTQMALANPLKNAMFGTNLPTLADLGKPAVPAGLTPTSTASMMVTAGTVMVNGGVMGGQFPSIPGTSLPGTNTGGLASVLGIPANVNGVRPDLMPGGLVNSPVAAATDPTTRALMYRQAISQIESGSFQGNYSALGPITNSGDRAYGRYQVMGNNIPSWTEQHYGERLTPSQFLANPAAQDKVFDSEFGSYVSKYGEGPAANKWFTGSPVSRGASDITGTTDYKYSQQFNANMQKLSQTTSLASKDIGTLGDTSSKVGTQITDGLSKLAAPAATPAVPAVTPTATTASGGNIFSSLFGGIFKLFGFADGTEFSPGGVAMVGERGRELVNLPRGSQVIPNHRLGNIGGGSQSGPINLRHEFNITVGGNGDSELLERMRIVAEESARAGVAAYDQILPDRIEAFRMNPDNRGSMAA